jgi:arylsulfatase A-like enzyme
MSRPNLLFVFADQLRADALGYAGDPNVRTPNLDRLADASVNFTTAVSTCPICTPYRACLLSGQYPLTHGLFMNDLRLPDNGCSIGQLLAGAGYDTGWIGKWHLDGHGRSSYIPPDRRQGFDYWKVLECTHRYQQSQYYEGNDRQPKTWPGYDAYAQTADAAGYIRNRADAEKPFALFLSFGPPHDPYDTAPADLIETYPPEEIQLKPNVAEHRHDQARKQLSGYYAHITALDQCVGELLATLDETGLADDTIVVFTSDHGDLVESHWTGTGPEQGPRKQGPWDESIRVPLLIRWPAQLGQPGRSIATPIATPDITVTLLRLMGVETHPVMQGLDYSPMLTDDAPAPADAVLIANYHPFADWRTARGGRCYRGLRTEQYTYVRDRNGPWLFYDNHADPCQLDNLVNQRAVHVTQDSLDSQLNHLLNSMGDSFDPPETLRLHYGYSVDDLEQIPYS